MMGFHQLVKQGLSVKEQELLPRFRETLSDVLRRVAALRVRSVEEQYRIPTSPGESGT
jgi:hypothetical protein